MLPSLRVTLWPALPELREIAVQHPPVWFKSRGALSPTCRGSQVLDSLIKRISVLLSCKAYRRRC